MENKNKVAAGIIVAVVVVAVAVYLGFSGGFNTSVAPTQEEVQEQQKFAEDTGASAVSEQGEVLNRIGEVAQNDVEPGSPEAPQQSNPISESQIPEKAVKLSVSASGFVPAEFTVKAGELLTISITSSDQWTHVFAFHDPSMSAVAVGVGPGETRAITFNAPKAGEYQFYCNVPGHEARGEVGKMIVK
ncbi:hypothetical protein A3I34_00045 [Candidatus Jorgensenbacteria bacterium RIFCSPLOWO2_02_FULL_45_12]|uniref:EfeO-type cupredoxin-like domain-containing protein n=1 Tax=Candidatus Jorgensenbacteria bacterium RIFCSPHIGHO2_02_FULL_45_20 TaxID=1798470 RepID=A0A1F6BRR7_9BACT|nr:MAG: hypothetical protein A3D55_01055 [Candidatus Jorgensenbacteria bacterium RIFCSPHIGHO2_02_FULL_45_20]OGG42529.1 MAG: hypothetical protein A3I34_00045 [Candidatus Jorgensenbacteria bacterium RIFCSPLOWO2_02_FULL_45_12]